MGEDEAKDQLLRSIVSPDGEHRVLIVKRPDGAYSYRQQSLIDSQAGREWQTPGPYLGIYNSVETAEEEALARMPLPRDP